MITALGKVNVEQDCHLVVERWEMKMRRRMDVVSFHRHKTGELPPDEMEYVELQRGESGNRLGVQTSRHRAV